MSIKILIDSASDITNLEAKELGIEMIPLIINFSDEEYYDGVDLYPEDFYKKLKKSKVLPKTSMINPTLFREDNVSVHCLGSTIGTHVGPNVLGLAFFKKV